MSRYTYVDKETNQLIPAHQLSTPKILELLNDGVYTIDAGGLAEDVESVMEQLRIELLIRELNL